MTKRAIAAALAAMLLSQSSARANSRYPAATQIVVGRSDPARYAVRTTFGVILSSDGGATWQWLCEDAMGITSTNADPTIGFTQAGALISADQGDGLARSTDFGCGWTSSSVVAHDKGGFFDDLVVRPDAPHTALALNSGHIDGTTDNLTQLFATPDDGATWAPHGVALDPKILADTVEVSPSDPKRIYVSGVRGDGPARTASLFVSRDDGGTWEEHAVPFDPSLESGVFVSGVDPANADVVYVRTAWQGLVPQTPPITKPARLLVTTDAGKNFKVAYSGQGPLFGFALTNGKVYVGGPQDGLRVASQNDLAFQQTSDAKIQGLMAQGGALWAASNLVSGFILGTTTDDGAHWDKKLEKLCDIKGPLACAPGAQAATCPAQWPKLHDDLFLCDYDAAPDGGPTPKGPDGGAVTPGPSSRSGCGCSSTPGVSDGAALALVALLLSARRRARAIRSRSSSRR
jgi:MYXO-CTERM domain-containing protein